MEQNSSSGSTNHVKTEQNSRVTRKWSQVLAILPVYLMQLCYGMSTGFPAILTPQLREPCSEFPITDDQESWIVSMDNLVTPIVCVLSGFLQQKFGPAKVLMVTCIPYCCGWISTACATSVTLLYASRLCMGCSNALLSTTVYTIEVSSKDMRGTYSLLEAVLRSAGCLLVYSLGYAFRWHQIAMVAPAIPLTALIVLVFVPESPIYLLANHELDKAVKALQNLYGPKYNVTEEVFQIKTGLEKKQLQSQQSGCFAPVKRMLKRPEIYQPFFIIVIMSLVQQFSGMSILRSYVVKIFNTIFDDDAPVTKSNTSVDKNDTLLLVDCDSNSTASEAYMSAIIIGSVRLLSSLLLSNLLLRFRRRSMYMTSAMLCVLSLVGFATCNYLIIHKLELNLTDNLLVSLKWASLVTACLLVFAVQLGVQTLPLLLSGELFPSDVRALCKSITRSVQCILLVSCLKLYPLLESTLEIYGTFYTFSAVILSGMPVVYFLLPETKDIGLELIQSYFTPRETIFYIDLEEENVQQTKV